VSFWKNLLHLSSHQTTLKMSVANSSGMLGPKYQTVWHRILGRDGSISTATCYELDGPGSNSCGGEIFRTCADQSWCPPSLLYSGYQVFARGGEAEGCGIDYPPPSCTEVKERVELYVCSHFGPSWLVLGWILPFISSHCWKPYCLTPTVMEASDFSHSSYT